MKTIQKAGLATIAACSLMATSVLAGPPDKGDGDNPPKDTGRTVIEDAAVICGTAAVGSIMEGICDLVANSNGGLDLVSSACEDKGAAIEGDNGAVDYALRNCDKNEAAQVRAASSAVLSWDDYKAREKEMQKVNAAENLCGYADKYTLLIGADKVIPGQYDDGTGNLVDFDLGADARDLAEDIMGWDYCSY